MLTITRPLRARIRTAGLALCLVGGAVGMEAVASHYSNEVVHRHRSLPGPATERTAAPVTTPVS